MKVAWTLLALVAATARGDTAPTPGDVRFQARLNARVPLDLVFKDETGKDVTLRELVPENRPVILVLAYYRCPMLCSLVLNGLGEALRKLAQERGLWPGRDFSVITVSIDPREKPDLAAAKKASQLAHLGLSSAEDTWHFLTGDKPAIDRLAGAVGFDYRFDEKTGDYAHGSGILVLTPAGRVSSAFYDVKFDGPGQLYYGLVEASQFKVGTTADRAVLLFCYTYDPKTGKYRFTVINVVRIAGVLTVLGLAILVVVLRRRERPRGPSHRPPDEGKLVEGGSVPSTQYSVLSAKADDSTSSH